MGNLYQLAGTPVQLTLTFAGLAHSSTLLAGRQSTAITFADAVTGFRVSGKVRSGATGPTVGTAMHMFWVQKIGDNAAEASASWPYGFGDSDADVTLLNTAQIFQAGTFLGAVEVTAATAQDWSFSFNFGGRLFSRVGCLWVVHNWAQLPDATNSNHEFWVEPYTTEY
jgi:hypothetical protein